MRLAMLCGAVLVSLLVVQTAAQDAGETDTPKLRKLEAAKPVKQNWAGREVIRNGGFDYGNSAWAINGGIATVGEQSGRKGDEKDVGAGIDVSAALGANGLLGQMLNLPDKLTGATLKLDWRMQATGNNPVLQGLTFAIGSFSEAAQFEPAANIKQIDADSFPGWQWQAIEHKLTPAELKGVNTMRSNKRQLVLIVSLVGDGLRLDVDNASLKVDGEFTPPTTPTFLAYAETISVKGPDGGRERFDIKSVTTDGSKSAGMFKTEGLSTECYGLAWRHDGAELCFSSTHEMAFSYFSANLYALDAKGMRRVTNPPSHADNVNDERKTGTVKLKVRNLLFEPVMGAIYVEGARSLGTFSLSAQQAGNDEAEVEIPNVVDFGEGVPQYVVVRVGGKSALSGVLVDVKAGETVESAGVATVDATLSNINATSPAYSVDGKTITYASSSFFRVDAVGGVPSGEAYGSLIGSNPALSPVDDTMVYSAYTGGLWLLKPGADKATELVSGDASLFAGDPVWFPDASGVVFVGSTANPAGWSGRNLCAVVPETKQYMQLTDLFNEDVQSPTISPDGEWVAAIRVMSGNGNTSRELWVWKIGEPQTCWQIETKGTPSHPAWCPK